jgi:glucose-6-phosphate 1-dehydrogenase
VFVALKHPPHTLFDDVHDAPPNHVRFRLSPDVVIELGARAKHPGESMVGDAVDLDACRSVSAHVPAYQRLLGDAMRGDQLLFARADAVEEAWRVVEPALINRPPIHFYPPGTWGPKEAGTFIPRARWHDPK